MAKMKMSKEEIKHVSGGSRDKANSFDPLAQENCWIKPKRIDMYAAKESAEASNKHYGAKSNFGDWLKKLFKIFI